MAKKTAAKKVIRRDLPFGQYLDSLLRERGITVPHFAVEVGVSYQMIYSIVHGKRRPPRTVKTGKGTGDAIAIWGKALELSDDEQDEWRLRVLLEHCPVEIRERFFAASLEQLDMVAPKRSTKAARKTKKTQ